MIAVIPSAATALISTGAHPRKDATSCRRIQGEDATLLDVDEGRKRVLLIAAAILAARKLAQFEGGKRVPATMSAISDAIRWAEEIMAEIDRRRAVK